jgi:hypothetical protein
MNSPDPSVVNPELRFRTSCFVCGNKVIRSTTTNNDQNAHFNLIVNGNLIVLGCVKPDPDPDPETPTPAILG